MYLSGFSFRISPPVEKICTKGVHFVPCHLSEGDEQEEISQQPQHVASALVNTSPKVPRVEAPNAVQPSRPESFDVTLQRKDNEGFGFVILTSKTKPPPGGRTYRMLYMMSCFYIRSRILMRIPSVVSLRETSMRSLLM